MKALLVMILAGWSMTSAMAGEVYVAAAASLTDVMKAAGPLYEKTHPGTKLTFVYGSTGMLRTQVLKGAPCDVFIGADRWFGGASSNMADVVKVETVAHRGGQHAVSVAGKGARPKGDALASWLDGAAKIGIGNPVSVPAGRYAKKLLESEKLWDVYTTKYVQGSNVREVLLWLRAGCGRRGFRLRFGSGGRQGPGAQAAGRVRYAGGTAIELRVA
jgi:molybdate transport system substrate-binding protein